MINLKLYFYAVSGVLLALSIPRITGFEMLESFWEDVDHYVAVGEIENALAVLEELRLYETKPGPALETIA